MRMVDWSPNRIRAFLFAVFSVVLVVGAVVPLPYPHFLVGSLCIFALSAYLVFQYGPFSVPTLVTGVLVYPALVPFITRYLYGIEHFSIYAVQWESEALASKIVFLVFAMVVLFVLGFEMLIHRDGVPDSQSVASVRAELDRWNLPFAYHPVQFALVAVIFSGSAYLLSPGPTIFHIAYSEQATYMPSWATWAGPMYRAAWALMFVMVLDADLRSRRYLAFLAVSTAGLLWLSLHGRRVESVGLMLLLFVDIAKNRLDLSLSDLVVKLEGAATSSAFGLYVFLLFGIGRLRNWIPKYGSRPVSTPTPTPGPSSTPTPTPDPSLTPTPTPVSSNPIDTLDYGGGFVGVPGGAHSFYGTIRGTVHLFDNEYSHLLGQTFLDYPIQAVPTPMLRLLGVTPPSTYNEFLAANYNYNGGNYFMNVYYANFSTVGVILAALVLAGLVYYMYAHLEVGRPRQTLFVLVAAALFADVLRAFWYTQLNIVDSMQAVVAVVLLYVVVERVLQHVPGVGTEDA